MAHGSDFFSSGIGQQTRKSVPIIAAGWEKLRTRTDQLVAVVIIGVQRGYTQSGLPRIVAFGQRGQIAQLHTSILREFARCRRRQVAGQQQRGKAGPAIAFHPGPPGAAAGVIHPADSVHSLDQCVIKLPHE